MKIDTITVDVKIDTTGLAAQLRDLADTIDPQPPSATAEDLRGAEAEIERLNAVIDAMPYPSELQNDATVEKVARALLDTLKGTQDLTWDSPKVSQDSYRRHARAVLAALWDQT